MHTSSAAIVMDGSWAVNASTAVAVNAASPSSMCGADVDRDDARRSGLHARNGKNAAAGATASDSNNATVAARPWARTKAIGSKLVFLRESPSSSTRGEDFGLRTDN